MKKNEQAIISAEDSLHDENNVIKVKLDPDLDVNIKNIEELFKDCADIVKREINVECDEPFRIYGVYTDGLINREVFPEVPPRVEYSLTSKGREVIPILDMMEDFGKKFEEKPE